MWFVWSQICHQITDATQVFFFPLGLDFHAGRMFERWLFELLLGWRTPGKGFGWPPVCCQLQSLSRSKFFSGRCSFSTTDSNKHTGMRKVWNGFVCVCLAFTWRGCVHSYSRGQELKCHKIPALGWTKGSSSGTPEHQHLQRRRVILSINKKAFQVYWQGIWQTLGSLWFIKQQGEGQPLIALWENAQGSCFSLAFDLA